MIYLSNLHNRFINNIYKLEQRADTIRNDIIAADKWNSKYLTESLLSDLWQHWCVFCREVIISSCRGCKTKSSALVGNRLSDNSWQRIGYEARQGANRSAVQPNRNINYLRNEPTWGDIDKLIDIIAAVNPNNKNELITAFGINLNGPKHLQITRNACAHKNVETMMMVKSISISYIVNRINQPYELSWEIDNNSRKIAIYKWIEDMLIIADNAVKFP